MTFIKKNNNILIITLTIKRKEVKKIKKNKSKTLIRIFKMNSWQEI